LLKETYNSLNIDMSIYIRELIWLQHLLFLRSASMEKNGQQLDPMLNRDET